MDVVFFVPTDPQTQGSMRPLGHGVMTHDKGPRLAAWRSAVRLVANNAAAHRRWRHATGEPVAVEAEFLIRRPVSVTRPWPTVRGSDIDKLVRGILDALSGTRVARGILVDDAVVVRLVIDKRYAGAHEEPGVTIRVVNLARPT